LSILNPLQGLAILLECKPDLILLDPDLSDTNGYEFCALLRKSPLFQHTPIIILTRQDGMIDRVRARLAGASEFISKPLESAQVLQVVQKHLQPFSDGLATVRKASGIPETRSAWSALTSCSRA
jgi:two-component system, chemotaxis family, response regulator PixG